MFLLFNALYAAFWHVLTYSEHTYMAGRITRTRPNILVTGTPGTGKTITCSEVADKTGYKHVDVGQIAKVNRYYEGWDEQYQCPILDEDKVTCVVYSLCYWIV